MSNRTFAFPALLSLAAGLAFITAAACSGSSATSNTSSDATSGSGAGGFGGATSTGAGSPCGPGTTECGGGCVDTAIDPAHCGACDNGCAPGEVCSSGQCGLVCTGGTTLCDGKCVNTANDPGHCGNCGVACAAGEVCSSGQCGLECTGGTTKCGDTCTNTQLDPAHCGSCDNACDLPGANEACLGGQCVVASCSQGLADCDGDPANGCEVNTLTNPAHCGGCNLDCPGVLNGTAGCGNGQCTIASCTPPFANCDGQLASGCNVDTSSDEAHCGGCNAPCAANQTCLSSQCKSASVTISTHNFNGLTEYPLDTDVCQCCGGTTSKQTADAFCVLAGYSVAVSWTTGNIVGTNCYCWDCIVNDQWASNCCSGSTSRPMILTVTCQ